MYLDEQTGIMIHNENNIAAMRKAGKLAAQVLDYITPFVKPGVSTELLDQKCHEFIIKNKAIPAPLNYKGFPKSICTSINHVICHGIPGKKVLLNGDIINIDITVILDGWHGDTSRMFWVGKPGRKAIKLVATTFEAMWRGIEEVKPGATLGDIGYAIQSFAEKKGYSIVRDFCGHGIGRVFHDSPSVLHYGKKNEGIVLKEGMFFTIEPMINIGKHDVKILSDGWTAVTRDKSLSAQFEHTVCVSSSGYEVFTLSPKNLNYPPFNLY
jgi:methionyl aminopeptidase